MTSDSDNNLIAALSDVVDSMYGDYDAATRDKLRTALGMELTQPSGTSLPKLTAAVQRIPAFKNREQAELIAMTLSYGAGNLSNLCASRRSGLVKTVKWFTADDAEVCGLCAALHGKVVGVNDCFLKARDTLIGKHGAEITITRNIEAPPLHEGCRCCCRPERISLD